MDAQTLAVLSLLANFIFGFYMYQKKTSEEVAREEIRELKISVEKIKDEYQKRSEFKEFKDELWMRLDRLEEDLKARISQAKQ